MTLTRWLWSHRGPGARLTRLALLPVAILYRAAVTGRGRAYQAGLLACRRPPLPTVAVGNLTVGGSGKTPVAAWIAGYYATQGVRPAIVLRGYGGDEAPEHRARVPGAIVLEDPDRIAAAQRAVLDGAEVLVLDDAFQRLDIARDLNIAVVSVESRRAAPWTLPAGPWREPWHALRRADLIVVTRKQADSAAARRTVAEVLGVAPQAAVAVAHLTISGFRGMLRGDALAPEALAGAQIVVGAAIGDPDSFATQCRQLGAAVRLMAWSDHHRFGPRDVDRFLQAARSADYVVITGKDAVKLRTRWPITQVEPLVARLELVWEAGREIVEERLDRLVARAAESAPPHSALAGGRQAG